jgi:hypothetical protein
MSYSSHQMADGSLRPLTCLLPNFVGSLEDRSNSNLMYPRWGKSVMSTLQMLIFGSHQPSDGCIANRLLKRWTKPGVGRFLIENSKKKVCNIACLGYFWHQLEKEDFHEAHIWLPAQLVVNLRLTPRNQCGSCRAPTSAHGKTRRRSENADRLIRSRKKLFCFFTE